MHDKDTRNDIAKRLDRYRISRRWTWEKLGKATGISYANLWKIAHRKVVPSELTVETILRELPDFMERTA